MQICTCSSSCLVRSVMCGAGSGAGSRAVLRRRRQVRKALRDQIHQLRVGQMPGRGDHQIVRRIAVPEPPAQRVAVQRRDGFGSAQNRLAQRVRTPEILREKLVHEVFGIVLRHANFFEDHRLLAVDILVGEFRLENHVRQHVEGLGKMFGKDARVEAHHFLGGKRVEHSSHAVDFPRDVFRAAPPRSLEHHVLDEMRDPVDLGRLAARSVAQPDSHRYRMEILHGLGDHHEPVRQRLFVDSVRLRWTWTLLFWHAQAANAIRVAACRLLIVASATQSANPALGGAPRRRTRLPERAMIAFKMASADSIPATNLLGKSPEELRELVASLGEPGYRGAQIYHALYAERRFDLAAMTNLPAGLRERLAREAVDRAAADRAATSVIGRRHSLCSRVWKGTKASALRGSAKTATVETVFMPSETRQTICISTQAGCAVDCRFCLTATLGLIRNLSAGEILGQILVALEDNRAALKPQTNIVLMGQGEPLLNFDAVMAALRIVLDPEALAISPKHVTLSTSGIVPGIERLAKEKIRPKLAISLNASSNEQRDQMMPINRKYPLEKLLAACKDYPLRPWEHLTFEYVLLGGFNDSPEDARRVVRLLSNLRAKVNLIPWNPGDLPYERPNAERVEVFRKIVAEKACRFSCAIRAGRT